jgi:hypothetical protein
VEALVIAGHFGFAAAVKSREREAPLWGLMLACVWLDIVFVPLLAAHVETMVQVPGTKEGAYGGAVIYADYTHSLVGAIALSLVLGLAFGLAYRRRIGIAIGLVAFSHWVLDLPLHRADMPLLPGNAGDHARLGFGLWRWPAVSMALEAALVLLGAWLYGRAALQVAGTDAASQKRARLCAVGIAVSGAIVLGLNAAGM